MVELPNSKWFIANAVGALIFTGFYAIYRYTAYLGWFSISELLMYLVIYSVLCLAEFYIFHEGAEKEEQKTIIQQLKDMRGVLLFVVIVYILSGCLIFYQRRQENKKMERAFSSLMESMENMKTKQK